MVTATTGRELRLPSDSSGKPAPPPQPGGIQRQGVTRRSTLRKFNWDALPQHRVVGKQNIWTVDKCPEHFDIDTKRMEELFGRKNDQKRLSVRGSFRANSPQRNGEEQVSVLDGKKSMNLSIFLRQFKRPIPSIIEDIRNGAGFSYGADKLTELRKMLPDKNEVKKFEEFVGERERLCESDLFMLLLLEIPSYTERVDSMILKGEFGPRIEALRLGIRIMTEAARELMDCDELHTVIRLVLKAGNYMNAGGYAGGVVGFRMSSLLKLAETKANKPGMNLMHFVVMEAEKNDKKLMEFPEKLQNIRAASRLFKQELESEFEKLKEKLRSVKGNINQQPEIREQMKDFIQRAEGELEEVRGSMTQLQMVSRELAEYLCEEEEKFKLEECCSIFKTFGEKFITATKENKQRVLLEIKRQAKEEERKSKRISIASCSHREKDLNGVDLEFLLLNNSGNPWRQRSLRQGEASIPRSQSLKQIRGSERIGSRGSSPTQEDVRRLREASHKVLSLQVQHGSCGQRLKQFTFAQNSRISEESSESVRSSGSADGENTETHGQPDPTSQSKAAKPRSPTHRQQQLDRRHTVSSIPQGQRKHPQTIPQNSTEISAPNIPTDHSQSTGNSASKNQTHFPEDSPPDLEKQSQEMLANVPEKNHRKSFPRIWSQSGETPPAASTHKAASSRKKRSITRDLSTEKPHPSPAGSKPSSSLTAVKPPAVHQTPKEGAKTEESFTWKFPNFFSKKRTKSSGGEGAAEEKVTPGVPASSSESTNLLSNFYRLFSDNKSSKHKNSSIPTSVDEAGSGNGSETFGILQ
ncbi:uncharacterized protein LOC144499485 [Mustelus asterias]